MRRSNVCVRFLLLLHRCEVVAIGLKRDYSFRGRMRPCKLVLDDGSLRSLAGSE